MPNALFIFVEKTVDFDAFSFMFFLLLKALYDRSLTHAWLAAKVLLYFIKGVKSITIFSEKSYLVLYV
jgi:hypothetical protein